MRLDMLIEISEDIKPIVVSDPYNLNVVGQVCQRGCPVHEYFYSNYSLNLVRYYYQNFFVSNCHVGIMQFLIVYDVQMLLNSK